MAVNVTVWIPDTEKGLAELRKRIARVHAQFILQYVEKLECPLNQKEELLDAVIQKFRMQSGNFLYTGQQSAGRSGNS